MTLAPRTVVRMTLLAAFVVFCGVQDRVTAAGARRYVALQRQSLAANAAPIVIDDVMRPAVTQSLQQAALWAGAVCLVGLGAAMAVGRPMRLPRRSRGGGGS